jgi:hypothetical protein
MNGWCVGFIPYWVCPYVNLVSGAAENLLLIHKCIEGLSLALRRNFVRNVLAVWIRSVVCPLLSPYIPIVMAADCFSRMQAASEYTQRVFVSAVV